jgi:type VII secretion integral membrane protein EccD
MTTPGTASPRRVLTRITLAGAQRRVDLVLPATEPIGLLLPDVVRLTGYQPSADAHAYQMSLSDGRVLSPDDSLESAGIADGMIVRVDPLAESPSAAVVYDVTDEVVDDLDQRRGRWSDTTRRWTSIAVCAVAAGWAALIFAGHTVPVELITIGATVLIAGATNTFFSYRRVGLAIALAGIGVFAVGVGYLPGGYPLRWTLWIVLLTVAIFVINNALGWFRSGVINAAVVLLFLVLWVVVSVTPLSMAHRTVLVSVISLLVLGLLPRFVAVVSGLTRLDDARNEDQPVHRIAVAAAIDTAHRGLAVGVCAASGSTAAAGWVLAQQPGPWTTILACLIVAVLLFRIRTCPLISEVLALLVAAGAVLLNLVHHWEQANPGVWWGGALVALTITVAAVVVLAWEQLAPYVRARARQVVDRAEGVAVAALIPVAVGGLDVYSRLLGVF